MKRSIKCIYLIINITFLFTCFFAKAEGTEVGNGGFVVICASNIHPRPISYHFYDIFSLQNQQPEWLPNQNIFTNNIDQNIVNIVDNYSQIDFIAADRIRSHYTVFWNRVYNANFKNPGKFLMAKGAIKVKSEQTSDCVSLQMISQVLTSRIYDGYYYSILFNVFANLDVINQTAAIVHELLYHEPSVVNKTHDEVVKLNQFILNLPVIKDLSLQEKLLWQVKNIEVKVKNRFSFAQYGKYHIYVRSDFFNQRYNFYYKPITDFSIQFYNSKHLKSAVLFPVKMLLPDGRGVTVGGRGSFNKNGQLTKAQLLKPLKITLKGKALNCTNEIYFDENEKITNCN